MRRQPIGTGCQPALEGSVAARRGAKWSERAASGLRSRNQRWRGQLRRLAGNTCCATASERASKLAGWLLALAEGARSQPSLGWPAKTSQRWRPISAPAARAHNGGPVSHARGR